MGPSARWFVVPALSLVLVVGGGCVSGSGNAPVARDTPPVLPAEQAGGPLYGVMWQEQTTTSYLSRLEPRTLRPIAGGGRVSVHRLAAWTISPDRTVAVFGDGDNGEVAPDQANVYVMDLRRMRQAAVIKTKAATGVPRGALWLGSDRVLLLGDKANYESVERGGVTSIVSRPALVATIVDLTARRVVAQRTYVSDDETVAVEPSRGGLVALFYPAERIGTARLGLIDTKGRLRVVPLDRVTAGFQRAAGGGDVGSRQNIPGLAVDATGGRAYVAASGSPVADVGLADLRVAYHPLRKPGHRPSVLGLVREAFAPAAAEAKLQSGPERHALWLGDGRLAVWGTDADYKGTDGDPTGESRPSGLQVIDTRDWSVRTLDPGIGQVVRAGDRLVTAGVTTHMASADSPTTGDGLWIRTPGPSRPVHLLAGRPVQWFQTYGPYAYVDISDPNGGSGQTPGYAVIDTRTGTVVGEHRGDPMPDFFD